MNFGITEGIVALLIMLAAIIPFILKKKVFKPRTKKVQDEASKFDAKIDTVLNNKKYADYLNACDDVLDKRERLQRIKNKDTADQ